METELNVAGMTCDGCERSVGRALEAIAGVRGVVANAETGLVHVEHEDGVAHDALVGAVEDAGYEVIPRGRGLPVIG